MNDRASYVGVSALRVALIVSSIVSVCMGVDCRECVSTGTHAFMVNAECENVCVEKQYLPGGWKQNLYRSIANNAAECNNVQYCSLSGDVIDGSFENGKWVPVASSFQENPICNEQCNEGSTNFPVGADGEHFLLFGASPDGPFYQGVSMTGQLIPTGTTHLSLFAGSVSIMANTSQKLVVSIDATVVLYIDKDMLSQFHDYYRNVDVDIHTLADGKSHSIDIMYYNEARNDNAAFVVDYLRFIKDNSLSGNSKTFTWPDYKFCGGGCRQDLLKDNFCHEQCNILACNYDNTFCENKRPEKKKTCYNSKPPISLPGSTACPHYNDKSCCSDKYDFAMIEKRIDGFKTGGCHLSDHCFDNIQRAVCAFCAPENNVFISNGTVQFSKYFRDGLYSSCKGSFIKGKNGACTPIEEEYANADEFLELFGEITKSDAECFDDLAYDPMMTGVIIGCSVAGGVVVIALIVVLSIVCYTQQKKKEQMMNPPVTELVTVDPETLQPPAMTNTVEQPPAQQDDNSLSSVTYLQAFD